MADLDTTGAQLPYWDDVEGPCWDVLALEGVVLPGVWRIEGDCERDIDRKKAKGADGAQLSDHGYESAELTLHGQITTRAEWRDMQAVLRELHPRKKGGPSNPIQADHPGLAVMGIQTIFLKSIRPPEVDSDGKMQLRIVCYEWIKPTPKKEPAVTAAGTSDLSTTSGLFTTRELDSQLGLPISPDARETADQEFRRLTDPNYKPSDSIQTRVPTGENPPAFLSYKPGGEPPVRGGWIRG